MDETQVETTEMVENEVVTITTKITYDNVGIEIDGPAKLSHIAATIDALCGMIENEGQDPLMILSEIAMGIMMEQECPVEAEARDEQQNS